jgi:hypothetical protein
VVWGPGYHPTRVRFLSALFPPVRRRPAPQAKVVQAPAVVATVQGESTVLLDSERGRYHMLNAAGGRVWALLAEARTRDGIVQALREDYEIPAGLRAEQVDRDVENLLERLWSQGLLEEVT